MRWRGDPGLHWPAMAGVGISLVASVFHLHFEADGLGEREGIIWEISWTSKMSIGLTVFLSRPTRHGIITKWLGLPFSARGLTRIGCLASKCRAPTKP